MDPRLEGEDDEGERLRPLWAIQPFYPCLLRGRQQLLLAGRTQALEIVAGMM